MDLAMFSQIAEITPGLYLSSAAAVRGEKIRSLGITHVINLTMDVPNLQLPGLESIQIHIKDVPESRLCLYFDRCADKINQVDKKGGKTLVHCVAGISRSSSICLAYLMKYQRMTLKEAYRHTKMRRSIIHPNVGFWRQLVDYERQLFGRNTVKMAQSNIGLVPDIWFTEIKKSMDTTRSSRHGYGQQTSSYSAPRSVGYSQTSSYSSPRSIGYSSRRYY